MTLLCLVSAATLAQAAQPQSSQARVQPVPAQNIPSPTAPRKAGSTFLVDAAAGWVDTGILLLPGDQVTFTASGTMQLTSGQTVTPDGMEHLWRDLLRQYPLPTARTGALIGRIGDSPAAFPFELGSSRSIQVRSAGDLFVRVNLSEEVTGKGELRVTVALSQSEKGKTSATGKDLAAVLHASIFDSLPRRDDDGQGREGDAVNLALIGSEQQVRDAFARSGWFAVDADRNAAILHGFLSTLAREPYREVPMSTLYLFQRPQDLSFARGDALRVAAERHHLRLWKTNETVDGKALWVGSATYDNGFERDTRNGNITHSISPAVDDERDFLRDSFQSSGSYGAAAYVTPTNPVREAYTATGGSFHTDGRILVMELD